MCLVWFVCVVAVTGLGFSSAFDRNVLERRIFSVTEPCCGPFSGGGSCRVLPPFAVAFFVAWGGSGFCVEWLFFKGGKWNAGVFFCSKHFQKVCFWWLHAKLKVFFFPTNQAKEMTKGKQFHDNLVGTNPSQFTKKLGTQDPGRGRINWKIFPQKIPAGSTSFIGEFCVLSVTFEGIFSSVKVEGKIRHRKFIELRLGMFCFTLCALHS